MYIERTHYFAKPGKTDAVRANRERACRVRLSLGLPCGTVYHKENPDEDGPDVVWQCEFASLEERERDLAARAASAEFEAVRKTMRELCDGFQRHFQKVAFRELDG